MKFYDTETKIGFISSIWDDDHIIRLDKTTRNYYDVLNYYK